MSLLPASLCVLFLALQPASPISWFDSEISCINNRCIKKPMFDNLCCVNQFHQCTDTTDCSINKACVFPKMLCNVTLDDGTEFSALNSPNKVDYYINLPAIKIPNPLDTLKDSWLKWGKK